MLLNASIQRISSSNLLGSEQLQKVIKLNFQTPIIYTDLITRRDRMKKLEDYVVSIKDFPEEGIIFRDVTSVLQDANGLKLAIDQMQAELQDIDFDVVVRSRVWFSSNRTS
jgi:hypothetical protein